MEISPLYVGGTRHGQGNPTAKARLTVRETLEALKHRHDRHHRRRNRASPTSFEEIAEPVIAEEWISISLSAQETLDRLLGQDLVTESCHVVEQVTLIVRHTECHPRLRIKNHINVILPARRDPIRSL